MSDVTIHSKPEKGMKKIKCNQIVGLCSQSTVVFSWKNSSRELILSEVYPILGYNANLYQSSPDIVSEELKDLKQKIWG